MNNHSLKPKGLKKFDFCLVHTESRWILGLQDWLQIQADLKWICLVQTF